MVLVRIAILIMLLVGLSRSSALHQVLFRLKFIVLKLFYCAFSYRICGRIPAAVIDRLYVISLETGRKLSWGRAWPRTLILLAGQLTGFLAII